MTRIFLCAFAVCLLSCAATPLRPEASTSAAQSAQAQAPRLASVVRDREEEGVREVLLSNGLKILLKEDHAAPVATLVVYYRVGSRNEHVGITGSSHLLEHLLFKGTEKFPGKEAVWGGLSRIGAAFNATTYYDRTNYYETVPIEQLPFAIELEADRMRNATFTDADRESEMTVVRNELERSENEPGRLLSTLVWANAIIAHPYHHPVIGWRSDVENVPTSQLRRYYDTYYQPNNAVVVVVGDIHSDETLALIVEKFGVHPEGSPIPQMYTVEEPQRGERRAIIRKPGELGLVKLAWKLPNANDPDVEALKVLQLILSGSFGINEFGDPLDSGISNRLYQALVEKELSTGVGMDWVLMIDPNLGTITASVRPGVAHQTVEDAIRQEVARLREVPVTEDELVRAKSRAHAAFGLSQDGTFGQAMALGYFGLIGDWRFVREVGGRVNKVTSADVQRVAQKYFVDKALTVGWFVPEAFIEQAPRTDLLQPWRERSFAALRDADDRAEAAVLAASARSTAAGSADGQSRSNAIQRRTFPNGLRVVVQENPVAPSFALAGSIEAGAVQEKAAERGLAGITAAMLERGTVKRSKIEIAKTLEGMGASLGFSDGFASVSVDGLALAGDLDQVLDILTEQLLHPSFPTDELAKLKSERIARIQQAEDSTRVQGRRALMQGLYPKDSPFYMDSVSDAVKSLKSIDRAAVQRWYRSFYGPDRTILTVVGKVKAEEVFAKLESRLGAWKKIGDARIVLPTAEPLKQAQTKVVFVPDKSNVDVFLGEPATLTRTSDGYYPAMLGNYILGGSVTGRLFTSLRHDKGLTYGVYSTLGAGKFAGPWTIWLTVNPQSVEPALASTHEELSRWSRDGVKEQELADAKTALTGLFKVGLATNSGLASTLNQYEFLGLGAEFVREHPGKIDAVTREQVGESIRRYFHPDKLLTVISGTVPQEQ